MHLVFYITYKVLYVTYKILSAVHLVPFIAYKVLYVTYKVQNTVHLVQSTVHLVLYITYKVLTEICKAPERIITFWHNLESKKPRHNRRLFCGNYFYCPTKNKLHL